MCIRDSNYSQQTLTLSICIILTESQVTTTPNNTLYRFSLAVSNSQLQLAGCVQINAFMVSLCDTIGEKIDL